MVNMYKDGPQPGGAVQPVVGWTWVVSCKTRKF